MKSLNVTVTPEIGHREGILMKSNARNPGNPLKEGFTLAELMVSTAILLLVLVYVMQAFAVQHKTYVVVDQVTEAQQNLRAISDLVERDVRRAGFMVPKNAAVCGYDQTAAPDTLFVSNTDAIQSVFDLESNNEDLSGDFGAPVSGTSSTWTASGSSFSLALDRLWVDVAADGWVVPRRQDRAATVSALAVESASHTPWAHRAMRKSVPSAAHR